MAKTIKFNLECNGQQVRTLEDLRNNFNIDDILQYYRDKVLEKWLTVRGYKDELNHLKNIKSTSPMEIIDSLVAIFKVEADKEKVHYATSVIQYREDRKLAAKSKDDLQKSSDAIYDAYFHRYEQLKEDILRNPKDKVRILAILNEIEEQYEWIFSCDYRNFFYKIRSESPLAVLCLLMNPFTRKFYVCNEEFPSDDSQLINRDVKEMYEWIKKAFADTDYIKNISNDIIIKNNDTGNRWVTLSHNKCIVIKLQKIGFGNNECAISNSTENENFLVPDKINGNFPILEGLQYQSQNSNNTLFYIEI